MKRCYLVLLWGMVMLPSFGQQLHFINASWMGSSYPEDAVKRPCPIFRKVFTITADVSSAVLNITALGLYEATVNGRRVADAYFTPGFTNYNKRLQFQVYEVKQLIKGANELRITVGEGWYRGPFRGANPYDNYGTEAGLLVELVICYRNGTTDTIVSDESWQCALSSIRYSEIYDGEFINTNHIPGNWMPVKRLSHSKNIIIPAECEPVRKQERFRPVKIFKTAKGEQVVDFGQNLAGWVQVKVRGRKGDTVRLFHAETLDAQGNFYNRNLRSAMAADIYVLNGNRQVLEPHFTYHGFRYIKIQGFNATAHNITAVALYSDLEKTGTFSCSDARLNQLQHNIEWSLNSNFFDIPTDCPQRSERLGWTGDAQVFAQTACFLRNTRLFYSKWLNDLATEQAADGAVPSYVPSLNIAGTKVTGKAGWGDAATIVPWTLFEVYADTGLLRRYYPVMKAWVDYITHNSKNNCWTANGYGDWLAPGDSTSLHYIDQCFYIYSTELLLKAAAVLKQQQDEKEYGKLLMQIRGAFLQYYGDFNTPAGSTQTALTLALAFDLLPGNRRQETAAKLAAKIIDNDYRLASGFLGTPYLLPVLSRYGFTGIAYRVLLQTQPPSWLYAISKGATTIWEKWDAITPGGTVQEFSLNHYAYGAVGNWMYTGVAGIKPAAPGYREIIIAPLPGGGLTWAKASYKCSFGTIVSSWKTHRNKLRLRVTIPDGVKAVIQLPHQPALEAGPGKHTYHTPFIQ